MKPVVEFTRSGHNTPELFACGKCGIIFSEKSYVHREQSGPKSMAEGCCSPGTCDDCGDKTLASYWTCCTGCSEKRRFDKAEKVQAEDWNGPVEWNDQFFRDVSEVYENYCDVMDSERPEYVYACDVFTGLNYDPANIDEHLREDFEDGFEIEGIDEVYEFFAKWNAEQKQEYWRASSKIVLLDWESIV